jgi:hypothetical protein
MAEVAAERDVPMEQVQNPRLRDSHRIQHHGPAPFYGRRKKTDASSLVHPGASK